MNDSNPDTTIISNRSGGAELNAGRDLNIGGDVVGRDKIVSNATYLTGDQQYDVHGLANPYLGLQSFTYADGVKYAGREKLIAETVARLTTPSDPLTLLFVTGASGSGKSSFVQAGLLPALEQYYAALKVKWAVFRPSRDPLAALADALWRQLGLPLPQFGSSTVSQPDFGDFLKANTPPQQVNVLVADQFEELFTQSAAQPREAFFALLTQLPSFRATRTHLIATVRADYLPELFAQPALYDIAKCGVDLRAMSMDELREAIQQPLRVTCPNQDKRFQTELVERLAQDAAEDATYLPLLQVSLEEIWRKGLLTVGSYTNLADAIQRRADKVLAYQDYDAAQPQQPRSPDEQAAILDLCLDLVDVSLDDEVRRDVRRRRSKADLVHGGPERAALIDALTQARLFSVENTGGFSTPIEVDLIHETLLSNWERLRQAIVDQRHALRQRAYFEQQLKEWLGQNRSDDYLLTGVHLAEAHELEQRDDVALRTTEAKDFVQRSTMREEVRRQKELDDARQLAEAQRLRAEEQRQAAFQLRRRATYLAGALVFALVLGLTAIIFGVRANQSAAEAQQQARVALSRQLAAQSLSHLDDHLDLALLLATAASQTESTAEARNALLNALQTSPQLEALAHGHTAPVWIVAFDPISKTLVTGSADGKIVLWDVNDPLIPTTSTTTLRSHAPFTMIMIVAYRPDGKLLATGNSDGSVELWDVTDPHTPAWLSRSSAGSASPVVTLAFSPDGKLLATGNSDGTIELWDVSNPSTPMQVGAFPIKHKDRVESVAFSPDGKTLASSSLDKTVNLWDVTDSRAPMPIGQPISIPAVAYHVAFSPHDEILAAGNSDGTIRLWDVRNLHAVTLLGNPLTGHTASVNDLAFSADGKMLISGSDDHKIILWDVSDPHAPMPIGQPWTGQTGTVLSLALSPDGKTLASGGSDGTIALWDMWNQDAPTRLGQVLAGNPASTLSVAFDPQSNVMAVGNLSGTITLWDVTNLHAPLPLAVRSHPSPADAVWSLAFSPDSKTMVSAGNNASDRAQIVLWDVTNPRAPTALGTPLTGQANTVTSMALSPDGRTLVTGSANGTILLWDVSDPHAPTSLGTFPAAHLGIVWSLAFSPDGKTLASGSNDKTVMLWDMSNPHAPTLLGERLTKHMDVVSSVAFSPDGKILASGSHDKTIILWDMTNPQTPLPLEAPLSDIGFAVSGVSFDPRGKLLAASDADHKTIVLWDVTNLRAPVSLGSPLDSHNTDVLHSMVFSPNGKQLVAGGLDKTIVLWDTDPISWQAQACQLAGRNLTQAEWQQYMGSEPYRKTCDQWPLESEVPATPTP